MAVEIGVVCGRWPEPESLALMTGFAMRTILGVSNVEVYLEQGEHTWTFHWGSAAQAVGIVVPSGWHEFAGRWFVSFEPGSRGEAVPLMLAVVLAGCAALLYEGVIMDEAEQFDRADLTPDGVLGPALRAAPLEAEAALRLLTGKERR